MVLATSGAGDVICCVGVGVRRGVHARASPVPRQRPPARPHGGCRRSRKWFAEPHDYKQLELISQHAHAA
eukprot:347967-Chlamydomonas_euryale.AAC.2